MTINYVYECVCFTMKVNDDVRGGGGVNGLYLASGLKERG